MGEKVKNAKKKSERIFHNALNQTVAVSLVIVSAFSIYALKQLSLNNYVEFTVCAALVIVGLMGAYRLFESWDK